MITIVVMCIIIMFTVIITIIIKRGAVDPGSPLGRARVEELPLVLSLRASHHEACVGGIMLDSPCNSSATLSLQTIHTHIHT